MTAAETPDPRFAVATAAVKHLARLLRQHPDWPTCPVCLWPIDPAAGTEPTHPNCR